MKIKNELKLCSAFKRRADIECILGTQISEFEYHITYYIDNYGSYRVPKMCIYTVNFESAKDITTEIFNKSIFNGGLGALGFEYKLQIGKNIYTDNCPFTTQKIISKILRNSNLKFIRKFAWNCAFWAKIHAEYAAESAAESAAEYAAEYAESAEYAAEYAESAESAERHRQFDFIKEWRRSN